MSGRNRKKVDRKQTQNKTVFWCKGCTAITDKPIYCADCQTAW
jgi:hypothetical protein